MKIRNGFVSNSSSSSFMMGIGKIIDRGKFDNWLKSIGLDKDHDIRIYSLENVGKDYYFSKSSDRITVSSFTDATASLSIDKIEEADDNTPQHEHTHNLLLGKYSENILYFYIIGLDGDQYFYDNDEYNYDKDLEELFDNKYQKFYHGLTEDHGVKYVDKTFGCGRNG